MKPIASSMTEVDNLPGEEIAFTIGDPRWVMRSLADLYSNRELAVVREYSTNARDAMIEAGKKDKPILVTLPNAMNPYFEVQDFGVGMSEDELKETYTRFGDSTKRDSDAFNGMLGFGSKSAVAYTNTFTVTAVKNGRKTVAVVTRKEDYSIVLKIVMTVETSEGNGVTIQVPVHNWREFETKARDFYRFWLPGTVLVNGKEPEWAVGDKIAENLYYYPNYGVSFVVMGNVAYRIANPDALFPSGMNHISFVAYVENGAVEFTPNREDLKYSDHTKTNLHKIITDFADNAIATAKTEIAAAKTHDEAYTAWDKWTSVIGKQNVPELTFKGDVLTDTFKIDGMRYNRNEHRYNTYGVNHWRVSDMKNTLIVTGFVSNLAAHHKAKVREWIDIQRTKNPDFRGSYIIFTQDDKVTSPWVAPSRVVSWERVKAEVPKKVKPKANTVAYGRKAGTFDIIYSTGMKVEQDVPQVKDLYYIMVADYNAQENRSSIVTLLGEFGVTAPVIKLPANRKDKFLRFYPHARNIINVLEKKINFDGPSLLSDEAKIYLATHHDERNILKKLDNSRIEDPELSKIVTIFKNEDSHYTADYRKHHRLSALLGLEHKFVRHPWQTYWDAKKKHLGTKYPLVVGRYNDTMDSHIYIYLNAVYAARKDGKNV